MAHEAVQSSGKTIIATANSATQALDVLEAVRPVETVVKDPVQAAAVRALLARVRASIQKAQAKVGPNVMAVPGADDPKAREAAVLLSLLAEQAAKTRPLPQGGEEAVFDKHDWLGWATVAVSKMMHLVPHPILRPPVRIDPFPNNGRVAVLGDWGTNLYGAPVCAASIQRDARTFALLLHLGDVYYSGTTKEMSTRFLDVWPVRDDPGLISRGLNSNHDMYSGGEAYFNAVLPAFGQIASYFALANDHWLLIGLDTAYVDHDMDPQQIKWLWEILDLPAARDKNIVFFSHQQLFSAIETQGWKLAAADRLGRLLQERPVKAWYWGHEHRCCIYDPHDGFGGVYARCIGHGGMPETREAVLGRSVIDVKLTSADRMRWLKLDPLHIENGGVAIDVPGGKILDGPNRYIPGEEEKFAPHGYAILEFKGDSLFETVHTPDADVIHELEIR